MLKNVIYHFRIIITLVFYLKLKSYKEKNELIFFHWRIESISYDYIFYVS